MVAGDVFAQAITTLAAGTYWMVLILAYGFVARVLTGPTLSPLGQVATRLAAPRLGAPKLVPGPPKRFAQALGAVLTVAAATAALGAHDYVLANILLVALIAASGLESVFAFCVGCQLFALLMRTGLIPEEVCRQCADLSSRRKPS